VDDFVGRLYDRFMGSQGEGEDRRHFYLLSDHGFTNIKTEVYLNRWLQDNGYLNFQNSRPETIMDIGPGSTAFALDPSRIHINLKNKYPLGTIDNSDYERVREELKEGMQQLVYHDGEPVAKRVYYKEELYHGPFIHQAPDLVVLPSHGYDLKGKVTSPEVFGRTELVGMHAQDNAFFYSSSGKSCKSIFDAKTVITGSQ
jgi:predicted AlkP superfamily phosphohydrolase/phosphomutase